MGHFGRGVGLQRERGFTVTRIAVGAPNDLQMARNLTGGLPVVNQGRLTSLGPIMFNPHTRKEVERGTG